MITLQGKTAVITGAAGGMGRVACRTFVELGAAVLATDLVPVSAALRRDLGEGPNLRYVAADLGRRDGVETVGAETAEFVGGRGLDILYNNHALLIQRPFKDVAWEEWEEQVNVNLRGTYFLCQQMLPLLHRGSAIINVAAVNARLARANMSVYSLTKAAIVSLTRGLALELAGLGIRVNCISPGLTDTPMPRTFVRTQPDPERTWNHFVQTSLMKRAAEPSEIVNVAAFVASDRASYMTGAIIPVDGGRSAY